MNRVLIEKVRAMFIQCPIPKRFWTFAVETAAYLHNRSPVSKRRHRTPLQVHSFDRPGLQDLRLWGSICYILKTNKGDKLDAKGSKAVLLGYGQSTSHYVVFDVENNMVKTVQNIQFTGKTYIYIDPSKIGAASAITGWPRASSDPYDFALIMPRTKFEWYQPEYVRHQLYIRHITTHRTLRYSNELRALPRQ